MERTSESHPPAAVRRTRSDYPPNVVKNRWQEFDKKAPGVTKKTKVSMATCFKVVTSIDCHNQVEGHGGGKHPHNDHVIARIARYKVGGSTSPSATKSSTTLTNSRMSFQTIDPHLLRTTSALRANEQPWADLAPFFDSKGYEFRSRYRTFWTPSWINSGRSPLECEDFHVLPVRLPSLPPRLSLYLSIPLARR